MQVAIRCHPYAPVAADELEEWLAREVDEIRTAAPDATVRLMRLSQAFSTGRVAVGWLIEVEHANGEAALTERQLDSVLRDMGLLGLQPTVLAASAAQCVSDGAVVPSSLAGTRGNGVALNARAVALSQRQDG